MAKQELKGTKKTLVYSSQDSKQLIESIFNVLTESHKQTTSIIFEEAMFNYALPHHPEAREICELLYKNEINVLESIYRILQLYAAGHGRKARWTNGKELVEFFHSQLVWCQFPSDEESKNNRKFFTDNFSKVVQIFEQQLNDPVDCDDFIPVYDDTLQYAKHLLTESSEEPEFFKAINVTSFILGQWDILSNDTYTFRTLASLNYLINSNTYSTCEERYKCIELIKKLSFEWE